MKIELCVNSWYFEYNALYETGCLKKVKNELLGCISFEFYVVVSISMHTTSKHTIKQNKNVKNNNHCFVYSFYKFDYSESMTSAHLKKSRHSGYSLLIY